MHYMNSANTVPAETNPEPAVDRRVDIGPLAKAALMLGVDFDDVEAYVCRPRERLEYLRELVGAE